MRLLGWALPLQRRAEVRLKESALRLLPAWRQLAHVSLRRNWSLVGADLHALAELPSLRSLDVSACRDKL